MSYLTCCVPSCLARTKDGITFHRFPNPDAEQERFQAWITNIGGEVKSREHNIVFHNRRVCHQHFDKIFHYSKNRLSPIAIPTLQLSGGDPVIPIEVAIGITSLATQIKAPSFKVALGNDITKQPGIPLHQFPNPDSEQERFLAWITNIEGEASTLEQNNVCRHRRVCHEHFEKKSIIPKTV